jgi:hypothetical protein
MRRRAFNTRRDGGAARDAGRARRAHAAIRPLVGVAYNPGRRGSSDAAARRV